MVDFLDDLLVRRFTKELSADSKKTVYDLFEYKKVDAIIIDRKTGEAIVDMRGLEFPVDYSKNACNIVASKYFRKAGVGPDNSNEDSIKQVADRMVGFWADSLLDGGIISQEQWQVFYDEAVYALLAQMWAPNSPQWFNTGIKRNYGIAGDDDGLFYFNEELGEVVPSLDRYTRTQASACFILSIEDSLVGPHSISDTYVTETKLFKGGSGVGTNFSTLRAVNERLSSGGVSSGVMSFLKGLDRNAGAIKSGGTTRRAAKMVILDIDHPEIEDFITWKAREEDKVRALAKMGYDTGMDGEAYLTVSGQNGNNSVRVDKHFMESVMSLNRNPDSTIELLGRIDNTVNREVPIAGLWEKICESAWACADPGLQFDDLYNAWHTCPAGSDGEYGAKHNRLNSTNPCSEYAFLDDSSCNLASINVFRFLEGSQFEIDDFLHVVTLCQLVLEASILMGQYPTADIARKTYEYRATGLGIADAASLLLSLGFGYESEQGRNIIAAICSIMTARSYFVSSLMAKKTSPFSAYEYNKPYIERVLRNHARCAGYLGDSFEGLDYKPFCLDGALLADAGQEVLALAAKSEWGGAIAKAGSYGIRNAQVSLIAPTGTISFAMDCNATSVEPFYSHRVYKTLAGGGSMEIVNPLIDDAMRNLGYGESEVASVREYLLEQDKSGGYVNYSLVDCPYLKPEHKNVFSCANEISPEGHVLMVAAITPMISGSVSKTVNMPNSASAQDISEIYKLAYLTGVKAISIYRDGCKAAQPLVSGAGSARDEADLTALSYSELLEFAENCRNKVPERIRPEGMRTSRTHSAKIGDIELYVTIGFYPNGKMAEVFVSTDKEGTVVKGLLASLSKAISNMLQYNVPPKEIARLLRGQQFEPSGFVSRHPYIRSASSIADLLSKIVEIELGDFSRCQVAPVHFETMDAQISNNSAPSIDLPIEKKDNLLNSDENYERLYGEVCPNCNSSYMFKNGTCKVCKDCGTTTGCS
ncbi:MAG: vitamin B12-dependent ribonucleotide reductase [Eubacteriaceae bacterium]|nr:vitamin B12-dependent ribonucleotide reductase [Eubacteriaceae bacterium]